MRHHQSPLPFLFPKHLVIILFMLTFPASTHLAIMHQQQHQFSANLQAATAGPTQPVQQVPQEQIQMLQQQYQMYANYPQVITSQMQQGRIPPQGYAWAAAMGAGRGVVPNISGHPQQMQLGAGKAGMQGSS